MGVGVFLSLGRSVGRREGSVLYADAVIRKRRYSSAPFKKILQNRNSGVNNEFPLRYKPLIDFLLCELKRPSNNGGDRETIPQSVILLRWGGGDFLLAGCRAFDDRAYANTRTRIRGGLRHSGGGYRRKKSVFRRTKKVFFPGYINFWEIGGS